jgi:hypothetical protein
MAEAALRAQSVSVSSAGVSSAGPSSGAGAGCVKAGFAGLFFRADAGEAVWTGISASRATRALNSSFDGLRAEPVMNILAMADPLVRDGGPAGGASACDFTIISEKRAGAEAITLRNPGQPSNDRPFDDERFHRRRQGEFSRATGHRRGSGRTMGGSSPSGGEPGGPRTFSDEVDTGSSKKMRPNKDLESFAIATRS